MFGDEWPSQRALPSHLVEPGEELAFGDIELTVRDLGPGEESPHDSIWFLGEDRRTVFSGDQGYNHVHCYLADGPWRTWLANLDRLAEDLPADVTLLPGHGDRAGRQLLDWQRGYVERFVDAVLIGEWSGSERAKQSVAEAIGAYLEADDLRFLMELSIEPVAARLGLLEPSAPRAVEMSAQRVALVSGASRGIGREIARQLLEQHGFRVLAGARDPSKVDLRCSAIPLQLDVTDLATVRAARARIESNPGRLDVLINNAGVGGPSR